MSHEAADSTRPVASEANLLWVDMEMSGLNPVVDRVLEIAIVVTDSNLQMLAASPSLVIAQPAAVLDGMDAWNQATHQRSGLSDRVRASRSTEADVERELIAFVRQWSPRGASPMCGNSVCQDRRFMARYLPELEAWFHYRNLDVSTVKELCKRWSPEVARGFAKRGAHTAMADILESIDELRYYRERFIGTGLPLPEATGRPAA